MNQTQISQADQTVVDIARSATALFGNAQVFQTVNPISGNNGANQQRQSLEALITSQLNERERLQGFKTNLQPAQRERLSELQARIGDIERSAAPSGLSASEVTERADLFLEAYQILGKDFVDVQNDEALSGLNEQIEELRKPTLRGAPAKRLESLESLKSALEAQIAGSGERGPSQALTASFTNVVRQINSLTPQRKMSELSQAELRQFDDLVSQVNETAGTDILQDARTTRRIEDLNDSITSLQQQLAALPAPSGPPTQASLASAFGRLNRTA